MWRVGMAEDLYHRFTRERLYEQVADHIEDLVGAGKLQKGDRLPPERELAERLGVARGVVREGVKLLGARGLVTVEPGRGTFIAEIGADSISDHLGRYFRLGNKSHNDLNELRRILEVEIAFLAAQRATAEDIARLKQAIQDMDDNIKSPEKYIAADMDFHLALATAAQNEMFPMLIEVLAGLLRESRQVIFQVAGAPERGQVWHRRICEAVEKQDTTAAQEAMQQHMQQVAEDARTSGYLEDLNS
jgi:GntR family transcriptional repressor for pyruvate dehydrogenase complex